MKISTPNAEVHRSEKFQELTFGIKAKSMPVALSFLRERIYTNPMKIVCQEYISNARDAMVEVGLKDRPIEVTVPTFLKPEFIVRDFGPGITEDRMGDVFVNYFESTKRDSNQQLGGFGLGSKRAPYAYNDSFLISSITPEELFIDENNVKHTNVLVKRNYIAYIDESQMGKIARTSESVTNEERGTTITIAVKKGDYSSFRDFIINTVKFWDVKPIFHGEDLKFTPEKKAYSGKGWYVVDDHYDHKPLAVIDGIPYEISKDTILALGHHISTDISTLMERPIRLFFNTGEIKVSMNRESIDYKNDNTAQIILKKLDKIVTEIQDNIKNVISKIDDYWEVKSVFVGQVNLWGNLIRTCEWKKGIILDTKNISLRYNYYNFTVWWFNKHGDKKKSESIDFNPSSCFVFNDTENVQASALRMKTFFEKHPDKNSAYTFTLNKIDTFVDEKASVANQKTQRDTIKKKQENQQKEFDRFKEVIHYDHLKVYNLSSYEKAKAIYVSNGKRQSFTVARVKTYNFGRYDWVSTEEEINKVEGIYTVLVDGKATRKDGVKLDISEDKKRSVIYSFSNKYFNEKIYGIPKRFEKQITKNLIHFEDAMKEKLEEIEKTDIKDLPSIGSYFNLINTNIGEILNLDFIEKNNLSIIDSKSTFFEFINFIKKMNKNQDLLDIRDKLRSYFSTKVDRNVESENLIKDFNNKYKNVWYLISGYQRNNTNSIKKIEKDIIEYINFLDKKI